MGSNQTTNRDIASILVQVGGSPAAFAGYGVAQVTTGAPGVFTVELENSVDWSTCGVKVTPQDTADIVGVASPALAVGTDLIVSCFTANTGVAVDPVGFYVSVEQFPTV